MIILPYNKTIFTEYDILSVFIGRYLGCIEQFIFMEAASKTLRTEAEAEDVRPPKNTLSPFNFPDLTIKIGDEDIFVKKDDLMEASPVFKTMFTVNFKEKDAKQIELPDKDPTTFALFLRHTLSGFDGLELQGITLSFWTTTPKFFVKLCNSILFRNYFKCGKLMKYFNSYIPGDKS